MPLNVACPHCQTRYKIPDQAVGKKVKCSSCGKPFSAKAASAKAAKQSTRNSSTLRTEPAPDALARMGLGAIKKQPEIFGGASAAGPDPLRNHVVQDPGFGATGGPVAANPVTPEISTGNDDVADVISNPFISEEAKQRHASRFDTEEEVVDGGGGKKKKKRKKKKKVHAAVKDSLDKATMTLLIMGVLLALVYGFFFYSAGSDNLAMAQWVNDENIAAGEVGLTEEEIEAQVAEKTSQQRILSGIGIGLGVLYIGLAFGVQVFPMTCSLAGLILYVLLELVSVLLNPFSLVSMVRWAIRITVCGALGKAFMDALNARYYNQMMKERRGGG